MHLTNYLVFDRTSSNPDRSAIYKYNIYVYNLRVSDKTHIIEGSQPLLLQLNLYTWEREREIGKVNGECQGRKMAIVKSPCLNHVISIELT